ncbi:histidine--tRNA ligase [Chelatococcus reniformis]|uniref:Histidine--tRNA ligase n=1 Tax=Chelatococcus reniformis TaxID=1494448 RepID=A0A916XMZ7_9HYPH|nr:histidine--tRNA ligase [Chelatococcus reniformis]GGC83975.1 histidine--tRNA ligase [Chelatococcus reniformis]
MSSIRPDRPKARLARGFVDRGPAEIAATETMLAKIREIYALYGFEPLETPFVEYTDVLGKFLPDLDRPNEGVFSFQDDDEQWLSLRYDLTAPLARYVAENFDALPKPFRSYRGGWVFRNEKPGPGRFRQFMQFDADIVGAASVAADAEVCMMAADTLEALGIARGDYVIKVNNRKVLDGVMDAIGLGGDDNAGRRLTVLRAIDKLDRLGVDGVRALLGAGRRDESGDFTKGAGLDDGQIETVVALSQVDGKGGDICAKLTAMDQAGGQELSEIARLVEAAGYADRVRIDPSVVRGLEYYTGPVYEAELTFQVTDEDGRPVRFGSVGGGGRYDGLVGRFRGDDVPATGFSIGVSRLTAALQAIKSPLVSGAGTAGPVVVLVLDRERMGDYQRMVGALRGAGIRAEAYLGSSGMQAQIKYADRRASPCVVIQGSNEKEKGEVTLKDLKLGAEIRAIKDRETYLARQAEAQFSVPEAGLVDAVKGVLARQRG